MEETKKPVLIVGDTYEIDKKHPNRTIVILVHIYGKHFCRVKATDSEYEWDTMCNRLTDIET